MVQLIISKRIEELKKQIQKEEEQLSKLPEGRILCLRNGKHINWFEYVDGERIYIPKRDKSKAEKLVYRKYLKYCLDDHKSELRFLELQEKENKRIKKSKRMLEDARYQSLLQPFITPESEQLRNWQNQEFVSNPYHPEQLVHKTPLGYYVRSKSEVMISMVLMQNQLAHRYECALNLGGHVIYPDFTIIHPKTKQKIYYEHFGMMDNPEYYTKAIKKISEYIQNGLIPSINLMITYETSDHPLDYQTINNQIQDFFSLK